MEHWSAAVAACIVGVSVAIVVAMATFDLGGPPPSYPGQSATVVSQSAQAPQSPVGVPLQDVAVFGPS